MRQRFQIGDTVLYDGIICRVIDMDFCARLVSIVPSDWITTARNLIEVDFSDLLAEQKPVAELRTPWSIRQKRRDLLRETLKRDRIINDFLADDERCRRRGPFCPREPRYLLLRELALHA